jgi:flagellar export protein FliJ
MKALHTLLRVAKADLDLLQRALGDQLGKQTHVEERIRTHEQVLIAEQKAALRDYESYRAYGGYAAVARAGRAALEAELVAIGQECDRLRTLISEAHVEMRKFERLLELQAERDKATADKRDADALDEMATMRAGRAVRS